MFFRIPQKTRRGLVARDTSAMADGLPVALAVSTAVPVPPPDAPLSQPLLPDRDDGPPGEEQIQQLRAQGFTEGKEPPPFGESTASPRPPAGAACP